MESLYTRTQSPKLYEKTYWGHPKYDDSYEKIIQNRDNFPRDFDIKCYMSKCKRPQYVLKEIEPRYIDHPEIYINKDGDYVIISSPYDPHEADNHLANGWTEVYPMYNTSARTFMKKIPSRRRFCSERR